MLICFLSTSHPLLENSPLLQWVGGQPLHPLPPGAGLVGWHFRSLSSSCKGVPGHLLHRPSGAALPGHRKFSPSSLCSVPRCLHCQGLKLPWKKGVLQPSSVPGVGGVGAELQWTLRSVVCRLPQLSESKSQYPCCGATSFLTTLRSPCDTKSRNLLVLSWSQ